MCNEPPSRQPLKYLPVVANVVRLPWEYSQIGCNSLEHSRPPPDKIQTVGSLLPHLGCYEEPDHMAKKVLCTHQRYWKPLASLLFCSSQPILDEPSGVCIKQETGCVWKQLVISQKILILSFCYQVAAAPWWLPVKGANWKHPDGPDSNIIDRYKTTLHKFRAPRNVFEIHSPITLLGIPG